MASFDRIKDHLSVAQAAATVLAVAIGGGWAGIMYYQSREDYSRANIEHSLAHFNVDDDARLLRVALVINNQSKRMLDLTYCDWKIERILPPDAYARKQMRLMAEAITDNNPVNTVEEGLQWSTNIRQEEWKNGSLIVEPGQEAILVRFYTIPAFHKVINVTTFCTDGERVAPGGSKIGSYLATTYDLGEQGDEDNEQNDGSHTGIYSQFDR